MKSDWLVNLIIDSKLIDNSFLSEKERYSLMAYLKEKKIYVDIAKEIDLTDERVRQLIENGIGKIFLTIKDLLAKSSWLEKTLVEKNALEQELIKLKNKFKKQLTSEQQLKMNFEKADISTDEMRFSARAKKTLDELNIKSAIELSTLTRQTLASTEKAGVKTVEEIIRRAEEYGIKIV